MKILVLANKVPYPARDGGAIATLNMMKALSASGHRVTCLCMNTTKHPFPVESIPGKLRSAIQFIGVDCDTTLRPLRMLVNLLFTRRAYIAERFRNGTYRKRLEAFLAAERFDLIQLEGPYPGHYLKGIRKLSPSPVLLRAHNVEHLIWRSKARYERSGLRRWYLSNMASRLERYEMDVVKRTDALIPISEPDAAYFRQSGYSNPMITIPAGLSPEDYHVTPLPAAPTLFFIGALDWLPNREGLEWFLERVFGPLADEVPGLMFHVAGRNAPGRFIRKLDHPRIVFHGEVEDAGKFMQEYRVMVAPLLTGSGIRIKILEAMALGRPVVTTGAGIAGIPATDRQEVMLSDDPAAFSACVAGLLINDDVAERIAEKGVELVRHNFDTLELTKRLSQFMTSQV